MSDIPKKDFTSMRRHVISIPPTPEDYIFLNKFIDRSEISTDSVYFEIVAEPQIFGERVSCRLEPEPEEIALINNLPVNKDEETFRQRLDRIQILQENYKKLWARMTEKLKQFQNYYKDKNYKIILFKKKAHRQEEQKEKANSDTDTETSYSGYSSASTEVMGKRKASSSSDGSSEEGYQFIRSYGTKYPKIVNSYPDLLQIGPNGTKIQRKDYEVITWLSASVATRMLLNFLFSEETLATHTLTGNQSPAFLDLPRRQLDEYKMADIIFIVCLKCRVSPRMVRATTTIRCATAAKRFRHLSGPY